MSTLFGSIVGRVVGPAGAPLPGAAVAALGTTQPTHDIAAVTGSDGTFRLGSMRPGVYRVEARTGNAVRVADVRVAAGAPAPVEIRFDVPDDPRFVRPGLDTGLAGLDIARLRRTDDRVRVTKYAQYPWRCICSLRILTRDGTWISGTGWLVSPRVVVTSGQCVFRHDEGGWAAQVEVIAGRNGGERPFGTAQSMALRSVREWTEQHDFDYDYGAVLLRPEDRPGDTLGWFGYAPQDDDHLRQATLHVAGYPVDGGPAAAAEEGSQWYASGRAREVHVRQIIYDVSTSMRQPGCAVWETNDRGERYGVAVHSWATPYATGGTRLTRDVCENIAAWVREAP